MTTNWTKISKASGTSWTSIQGAAHGAHSGEIQGSPIGLLMALTYQLSGTIWTDITKASGTSWTKITKAT